MGPERDSRRLMHDAVLDNRGSGRHTAHITHLCTLCRERSVFITRPWSFAMATDSETIQELEIDASIDFLWVSRCGSLWMTRFETIYGTPSTFSILIWFVLSHVCHALLAIIASAAAGSFCFLAHLALFRTRRSCTLAMKRLQRRISK